MRSDSGASAGKCGICVQAANRIALTINIERTDEVAWDQVPEANVGNVLSKVLKY